MLGAMTALLSDRLMAEVAARRDDLVRLAQALIRMPTLNPPGRHIATSASFWPGAWPPRASRRR
jgi:hypothetical protein